MRWSGQEVTGENGAALPGLTRLHGLVRSVTTPEFAGITFHEVLAKSALNHVPGDSSVPFDWTVNPYRGCSHACVYCFARPTHAYLDLDVGQDFDTQVVVKVNVAEVLAREVSRPSWGRHHVALGTNTDPYQRAEGRYRLMPGIIAALAASGTPFSVLTKGTLLRRDLPLLVEAADRVPVDLAVSVAVYDEALHRSLEPGTPSPQARLATVRAAADLGFDVGVFLMPVLPHLTDSVEHLDHALGLIADSGAAFASYTALHLRSGVRDWFLAWLGREHPELLPRYHELYATSPSGRGGSYVAKDYREWLARRIQPLIAKHGLDRSRRSEAPPRFRTRGTWAPESWAMGQSVPGEGLIGAELGPASPQPTLF